MEKDLISFRIDQDLKSKLVEEAGVQNRTVSNMIVTFIKEGISRKENPV